MNALKQRWQSGCLGKAMIVGGIVFLCLACGFVATLYDAFTGEPTGEIRATGEVTPKPLERAAVTPAPATKVAVAAATATLRPPTNTPRPTNTPGPTDTPSLTDTPLPPTATPEPEEMLRALIEEQLGDSNRDVPRIKDVYLGDGTVAVSWAINDNLTENMIRRGVRMDVLDVLQAIKASGAPFDVVNLFGSFSMVDVYGNTEETNVVKLVFTRETFDRLNLDNILLTDTIYEAADNAAIHPAFQGE